MKGKLFEVTLVRSPIGFARKYRSVLKGMGLRRIGGVRLLQDTPQARGMIFKMSHMLQVRSFKSDEEYKKYKDLIASEREKPPVVEVPRRVSVKEKKEVTKVKKISSEAKTPKVDESLKKGLPRARVRKGTRRSATPVKRRTISKGSYGKKDKED